MQHNQSPSLTSLFFSHACPLSVQEVFALALISSPLRLHNMPGAPLKGEGLKAILEEEYPQKKVKSSLPLQGVTISKNRQWTFN